jgi:hypothetical protein
VRELASRRLLERLIAGKGWIAVVAFALIGIVTLQLALLALNSSIGRTLVREAALQRENSALSIEDSERTAGYSVEPAAVRLGMQLIPSGALRFLNADPSGDPQRAAHALSTQNVSSSAAAGEATAQAGAGEGSAAQSASGEATGGTSETTSTAAAATGTQPGAGAAAGATSPGAGSGEGGTAGAQPSRSEAPSTGASQGGTGTASAPAAAGAAGGTGPEASG